jgi:hypothetical protein
MQIAIETDRNARLKAVLVWRYDVSFVVISECYNYSCKGTCFERYVGRSKSRQYK